MSAEPLFVAVACVSYLTPSRGIAFLDELRGAINYELRCVLVETGPHEPNECAPPVPVLHLPANPGYLPAAFAGLRSINSAKRDARCCAVIICNADLGVAAPTVIGEAVDKVSLGGAVASGVRTLRSDGGSQAGLASEPRVLRSLLTALRFWSPTGTWAPRSLRSRSSLASASEGQFARVFAPHGCFIILEPQFAKLLELAWPVLWPLRLFGEETMIGYAAKRMGGRVLEASDIGLRHKSSLRVGERRRGWVAREQRRAATAALGLALISHAGESSDKESDGRILIDSPIADTLEER